MYGSLWPARRVRSADAWVNGWQRVRRADVPAPKTLICYFKVNILVGWFVFSVVIRVSYVYRRMETDPFRIDTVWQNDATYQRDQITL